MSDLKSALAGEDASADPGEAPGARAGFHEARRGDVQGEPGGAAGERRGGGSGSGSDEDVVDADFEEIPEDERKRSAS